MIANKAYAAFDRIISPLCRDNFLADYWGKKFLHLPGKTGKFHSLLPWSELNHILDQCGVKPPRIRLFQDGKIVDPEAFVETESRRIKPPNLIRSLSKGATLIVDSVDEFSVVLRDLVEAFEEVLRTSVCVNLYAGWRRQKGFDLHWDPQDTIILQVSGSKHWQVYSPTRLHPLKRDVQKVHRPTTRPVWEGILKDGDAIYLPRGWWHVASPLDEPSLHLTVTVEPGNGVDFFRWVVEQLKSREEIRMNIPHITSGEARKQHMAELRGLMIDALSDDDLIGQFDAYWQARIPLRPRIRLPFAPMEQLAPLRMDTQVRLAATRCLVFDKAMDDGRVSFSAGDIRGECGADLVPALERLSGNANRSVGELCAYLSTQESTKKFMVLLTGLAMDGAIWTEQRDIGGGTEDI